MDYSLSHGDLKILKQPMKMQGSGCDKRRVEVPPSEVKESAEGTWKINHALGKGVKKQIRVYEEKSLKPWPSPEIALLQQQEKDSERDKGECSYQEFFSCVKKTKFPYLDSSILFGWVTGPKKLLKGALDKAFWEAAAKTGYRDAIRAWPNGRKFDLRTSKGHRGRYNTGFMQHQAWGSR